jgi:hypothetical protein
MQSHRTLPGRTVVVAVLLFIAIVLAVSVYLFTQHKS